jgi:hypothetical protein
MARGRPWLWFIILLSSAASADTDIVGLVNLVEGDATFASQASGPQRIVVFMQVNDGYEFTLAAGGIVRLVFARAAREERWEGPARFRATLNGSESVYGRPTETKMLPAIFSQHVGRIPELVRHARIGGLTIRRSDAKASPAASQSEIAESRNAYEQMRGSAPADDITPELLFQSILFEYKLYEWMKAVVNEMLRKQPDSEDARAFSRWMRKITP